MKRNNKKGFTIVELVIVIAVIAILSAVLIPTFGGIVEKAEKSAAQQEAKNAHTQYLIETDADDADLVIVVDDTYFFSVTNGQLKAETTKPTCHDTTVKVYGDVDVYFAGAHAAASDEDATCPICGVKVTP